MSADEVALVTGSSRGIGAAIARRLAEDGLRVALTYAESPHRADEVVGEIERAGGQALGPRADAADPDAVTAAVKHTVAAYGGLDVLVSNAGVARVGALHELTPEQIDRTIDVNVRGVVHAVRGALPHLGDGGRIITIGSVNAERIPFAGGAAYGMTKAAIAGLVRGLAQRLGLRGITVNNIQPGPTADDRMTEDGPLAEAMLKWLAVPRIGSPREIADLVSYLMGPEAAFVKRSQPHDRRRLHHVAAGLVRMVVRPPCSDRRQTTTPRHRNRIRANHGQVPAVAPSVGRSCTCGPQHHELVPTDHFP